MDDDQTLPICGKIQQSQGGFGPRKNQTAAVKQICASSKPVDAVSKACCFAYTLLHEPIFTFSHSQTSCCMC